MGTGSKLFAGGMLFFFLLKYFNNGYGVTSLLA